MQNGLIFGKALFYDIFRNSYYFVIFFFLLAGCKRKRCLLGDIPPLEIFLRRLAQMQSGATWHCNFLLIWAGGRWEKKLSLSKPSTTISWHITSPRNFAKYFSKTDIQELLRLCDFASKHYFISHDSDINLPEKIYVKSKKSRCRINRSLLYLSFYTNDTYGLMRSCPFLHQVSV